MKSLASPYPIFPTYLINRDISDKMANDYIEVIFPSVSNLVLSVISIHFHLYPISSISVKLPLSWSHKWPCASINWSSLLYQQWYQQTPVAPSGFGHNWTYYYSSYHCLTWIINQLFPTKHPIKRRESSCFKFVGINNMDQWSLVCFPVGLLLRRKCTQHGNKNSIVTLGYPVAHCIVCCGSWLSIPVIWHNYWLGLLEKNIP